MRTITKEELTKTLGQHKLWLQGKGGEKADLSGSNLSGSNLRGSNLSGSNLRGSNLSGSNLSGSNLSGSDLSGSDLRGSDLSYSNLSGSNLRGSNLSCSNLRYSDLSGSDLRGSDLSYSDLRGSDLSYSNLSGSNLSGSDLRGSDLSGSNLSGVKGLLDPIDWMYQNLEKIDEGYLAYKTFNSNFSPPDRWKIEEGAEITEVINPLPTLDCACGVNVVTLEWVKKNNLPDTPIWQVLIKWEWLPGVVVSYNTDGKFRCSRVKLLRRV